MSTDLATLLRGRRILITGAARGIGAAVAERLTAHGARVGLLGLEPDHLAETAKRCAKAPWVRTDVSDRADVQAGVAEIVGALGGLDAFVANAGVAAQLPIVGGDPEIFEKTVSVNLLGAYYTSWAAGRHITHEGGYGLLVSSMATAVHLPLMGAYSASKSGVEALGNTLRVELRPYGARVGVAYFAEIDTDMTTRGFGTRAAEKLTGGRGVATSVAPLDVAVDKVVEGIARRRRTIVAPSHARPGLVMRGTLQRIAEKAVAGRVREAVETAQIERVPLTTPQPDRTWRG